MGVSRLVSDPTVCAHTTTLASVPHDDIIGEIDVDETPFGIRPLLVRAIGRGVGVVAALALAAVAFVLIDKAVDGDDVVRPSSTVEAANEGLGTSASVNLDQGIADEVLPVGGAASAVTGDPSPDSSTERASSGGRDPFSPS